MPKEGPIKVGSQSNTRKSGGKNPKPIPTK